MVTVEIKFIHHTIEHEGSVWGNYALNSDNINKLYEYAQMLEKAQGYDTLVVSGEIEEAV